MDTKDVYLTGLTNKNETVICILYSYCIYIAYANCLSKYSMIFVIIEDFVLEISPKSLYFPPSLLASSNLKGITESTLYI